MNKRKGKIMKIFWVKDETEYIYLIDCIEGNFQEEAFRIIWEINERGDL